MSYVDRDTAHEKHVQYSKSPWDPGEDYHLLSTSAAIKCLDALESCEDIGRDVAKSMLPAIVAAEVDGLLELNRIDVDLDRREDLLAHATGQAMHLFNNP